MSVIDITALIASPFFGLLVDWTGLNGWLVSLGNLFGVTGFVLLGLTMLHPLVGILCIGVHYCFMAAALSPCVSILVDEKFEGTAYSFVSALVNLGGAGTYIFERYDYSFNVNSRRVPIGRLDRRQLRVHLALFVLCGLGRYSECAEYCMELDGHYARRARVEQEKRIKSYSV